MEHSMSVNNFRLAGYDLFEQCFVLLFPGRDFKQTIEYKGSVSQFFCVTFLFSNFSCMFQNPNIFFQFEL